MLLGSTWLLQTHEHRCNAEGACLIQQPATRKRRELHSGVPTQLAPHPRTRRAPAPALPQQGARRRFHAQGGSRLAGLCCPPVRAPVSAQSSLVTESPCCYCQFLRLQRTLPAAPRHPDGRC